MTHIRRVPTGEPARVQMAPSAYVTAEALREGSPNETELAHLVSDDGNFTVGVWSADPYSEQVIDHDGYEYTLVLEGSVSLTGEDGVTHTYKEGDTFTIEPGWSGEYRVTEPLLKHFVFYSTPKD